MKIIEPSVEYWKQENSIEHVCRAAQISYQSEPKKGEAAEKFYNGLINSGHCYTGESEVLTSQGWIKWKDYNGEEVAVINEDRTFKGFESPLKVHHYLYTGDFYYYPSMGIEVTKDHTMFGCFRTYKDNYNQDNNYIKFKCGDSYYRNSRCKNIQGERPFKTPRCCEYSPKLDCDVAYGELIGFWIGDGCHEPHKISNRLRFHLKKTRKIEYIKRLAERLGFEFSALASDNYTISHEGIGNYFNESFYKVNNKYIDKDYAPNLDIVFGIFKGLLESDGNTHTARESNFNFCTTSRSVANWVLNWAAVVGYVCIEGKPLYPKAENQNIMYRLFFNSRKYSRNNDQSKTTTDNLVRINKKTEEVYCVTTSTGLILVRGTNGVPSICGNCSCLRHESCYYIITKEPKYMTPYVFSIHEKFKESPYIETKLIEEESPFPDTLYIATNGNFLLDHPKIAELIEPYKVTPEEFFKECPDLMRYTFCLTTQISTTRELLRHSPQSCTELSTRYIKFGGKVEPSIVKPHWLHNTNDIQEKGRQELYLSACNHNFETYNMLINEGLKAQDARGVLPLDTMSKIVMTHSIREWRKIIDMRYYGTTGTPHPNIKLITGIVKDQLNKLGYNL